MTKIKISKEKLYELMGAESERTVMVPVKSGEDVEFKAFSSEVEPCFSYVQTKNSIKDLFFPRCETVVKYKRTSGEAINVTPQGAYLVVGLKPCDASGIDALNRLFSADPEDPFFTERRKRSLLVTQMCSNSDDSCFCTSVAGGPQDSCGSDVMMAFNGDDVILESVTESGKIWLESIGGEPCDGTLESGQSPKDYFDVDKVMAALEKNFENVEFWENASDRCLGCGTCTFVCPTCHCFDIVDEGDYFEGCRLKNWDSCSFGLFTRHTSGHNPRTRQYERWRQRINHKFRYFKERFDRHLCTGCGRCVRSCPVCLGVLETAVNVQENAGVKSE